MTFSYEISQIPAERIAIISPSGQLSFRELQEIHPLGAASVLMCTDSAIEAAKIMAATDGVAQRIAVVSPHFSSDVIAQIEADLNFEMVITSGGFDVVYANVDVNQKRGDTSKWLMMTSGTTGVPKIVEHDLKSLSKSTRKNIDMGANQKWGMLYDFTRFAGLQVFLQSLLSGATLIAPNYGDDLADQLVYLAENGCTHLSATPTLWRKILMTPASQNLNLMQITLGGEISDQKILNQLSAKFPDARISHVYASTESGVGFPVTDKVAGFPAAYLETAPIGIALKIEDGILHIENLDVGSAYFGSEKSVSTGGWVNTGDRVEVRDGRVFFLGRDSGVINVGGNKVSPEEIEAALLAQDNIALARVYAKQNPITGALVIADVVLIDKDVDKRSETKRLLANLRLKLENYQIPAMINFVDDFNLNVAGKLSRN